MNTGKTLFAQLMDFLPWSTFDRIVGRYDGNRAVRKLSCAAQYQIMAFAQLTYRESLRDIEACLSAQTAKLYHMGLREPVRRSTLADANESRDWRIYAEFAQRLIAQARRLYATEDLGLDLTNSVYALDSTTIDLCMSVFPWAHFRSAKSAVKMHTLLDLRGNIPSFIHISDGKLHDVHALDMLIPEPGAIYVMDRGYIDFARLHTLHQAGAFFVTGDFVAGTRHGCRRMGGYPCRSFTPWSCFALPFKYHAEHRHHIPKPRYRVTNWAEYDASLKRRGSLTVWFTDEAVQAWRAEPRTTPGGQPHYSALAITTALTMRVVFRLGPADRGADRLRHPSARA